MPIHELKDQIAKLPEQPGVYLYFNGGGDTIYVGKALALRDRVRNYLGAYGSDPKTDALLDEVVRLEVIVTDSVVEALALENNLIKQRITQIQHPAARRQELPFSAADDQRALSARARGAPGGARRQLLRRPVSAGALRPQDDGAHASAVRHPLVQRGDYRQTRAAVPRVRHQALHRSLCRHGMQPRRVCQRRQAHSTVLEGKNDELVKRSARACWMRGRGSGRAAARRGGRCRRCTIASGKWPPPRSGIATSSAQTQSSRRRHQVFQVRSGRVVERIELGTEDASSARARRSARGGGAAVLRAAGRAAGNPPAVGPTNDAGVAVERRFACAFHHAAARREAGAGGSGDAQRGAHIEPGSIRRPPPSDAPRRCRLFWRCAPRRIECFDISTIQGRDGGVDGGVRRRAHAGGAPEVSGSEGIPDGIRDLGSGFGAPAATSPRTWKSAARCRRQFAAGVGPRRQ